MDVIVRSKNNPVNDITTPVSGLTNDLNKAIKTKSSQSDLNNYRPVSNLCFIAKILETLVLSQVSSYLNSQSLQYLWWWCRPHPVHEHAQDLRPSLGARQASPPTRQAAQLPTRGLSTNPRPLVEEQYLSISISSRSQH